MDYDQIIPLLVAGMQEQQRLFEQLQSMTAIVMATNSNFSSDPKDGALETSRLLDSSPNPFRNSTELHYQLVSPVTKCEIRVFDLFGTLKKNFIINSQLGHGSVELSSNDLNIKGKYVVALFLEGAVTDAKTIILE